MTSIKRITCHDHIDEDLEEAVQATCEEELVGAAEWAARFERLHEVGHLLVDVTGYEGVSLRDLSSALPDELTVEDEDGETILELVRSIWTDIRGRRILARWELRGWVA